MLCKLDAKPAFGGRYFYAGETRQEKQIVTQISVHKYKLYISFVHYTNVIKIIMIQHSVKHV